MPGRNGAAGAQHPVSCALTLTPDEEAVLERRLDALTAREREVVRALCAGGPNEALADRLCVALPTLRTHLMRVNQKLGSESKDDIVRLVAACLLDAYRRGELPPRNGRATGPSGMLEVKAPGAPLSPARASGGHNGEHGNHRYR
ncbi:MAG: helix-turn-helix transcriptional regulator [Phycisphaerales bacterium]